MEELDNAQPISLRSRFPKILTQKPRNFVLKRVLSVPRGGGHLRSPSNLYRPMISPRSKKFADFDAILRKMSGMRKQRNLSY